MSAHEARADLLRLINGFQASQALHVAATLRLADLLGVGPKSCADIAESTKTHPVALYRLLRALAAIGVFHEDENNRFALTAVGEFLRSDVSGTHAPMAELVGRPYFREAWGDLLYSVRTGITAFEHVHGKNVWEYRTQHPDEGLVFDRTMATATDRFAEAVLEVCDFRRFRHVVDVGGGDGMFLVKILATDKRIRGTLFDQPHVIARAAASIDSLGLSDRCQALGGNFFASVPAGGDAYLLKWILHDWDDTASIDLLRSCRRAMKPGGRIFVVEHVIGSPNTGSEGKFLDLTMMVLTGGRERTQEEFATLFDRAGFRLMSVRQTTTSLNLIEGELANAR
jgi:hypothetical protein